MQIPSENVLAAQVNALPMVPNIPGPPGTNECLEEPPIFEPVNRFGHAKGIMQKRWFSNLSRGKINLWRSSMNLSPTTKWIDGSSLRKALDILDDTTIRQVLENGPMSTMYEEYKKMTVKGGWQFPFHTGKYKTKTLCPDCSGRVGLSENDPRLNNKPRRRRSRGCTPPTWHTDCSKCKNTGIMDTSMMIVPTMDTCKMVKNCSKCRGHGNRFTGKGKPRNGVCPYCGGEGLIYSNENSSDESPEPNPESPELPEERVFPENSVNQPCPNCCGMGKVFGGMANGKVLKPNCEICKGTGSVRKRECN